MRVDQATFAVHRAALLEAAGRLFRDRGIGGVTVAEVSRAAGLTHGAFYGHYASKESLAEAACRHGFAHSADRWRARALAAPDDPLGAIIDGYLTTEHRDEPGAGCALPALGAEVARAGGALSAALDEGARALLDVLEEQLAALQPTRAPEEHRLAATALLALLAGGVLLARALAPDPVRSAEALHAAKLAARALISQPAERSL
jgi:TetR/AcrR family transcriptional repressor of nem operon